MTTLSADELDAIRLYPTWCELLPVRACDEALAKFVREELTSLEVTAANLSVAIKLGAEFKLEIWPHRVPTRMELVVADRAGKLEEKIAELNEEFTRK
jgi:hypothetical protein